MRGPFKRATKGMGPAERKRWFRENRQGETEKTPESHYVNGGKIVCSQHIEGKRKPLKKHGYWTKWQGDECVAEWYKQGRLA